MAMGVLSADHGNGHAAGEESFVHLRPSRFHEELQRLNWEGNLPPLLDIGSVGPGQLNENGSVPSSNGIVSGAGGPVRNWHLYNEAQVNEGLDYMALLGGLSDLLNLLDLDFLPRGGRGRSRCYLGTVVFCLVHKAYHGFSSRRLQSELKMAATAKYLRAPLPRGGNGGSSECEIPAFNTVLEYQHASWLTPILMELVTVSALPVRRIESAFAGGRHRVERPAS